MLRTPPEAEIPVPLSLPPDGERVWRWAVLGMHAPYYLVEYNVDTEDGPFVRHLITSEIELAKGLQQPKDAALQLRSVCLLSPGYVNGSQGYQLARLAEVWSAPDRPDDLFFVLESGKSLQYSLSPSPARIEDMELLLDLRNPS